MLSKDVEYIFRVRAQNRFGVGPVLTSAPVSAKHGYKVPGPPGQPTTASVTKETVTIKWNDPVNDGGSPVTGYDIEMKGRNSLLWKVSFYNCLVLIYTFIFFSIQIYWLI